MVKFREFVDDEVKTTFKWNETIQEMFQELERPKKKKRKKKEKKNEKKKEEENNNQVLEVGFGLSKITLKRVFDYVKSWLIRYNIPYEATNPYLTLSMIEVDDFSEVKKPLIKEYKTINENFHYEPKGVMLLRDENYSDLDFISIDFRKNKDFNSIMNPIYEKVGVKKVKHMAFLKLFSIAKESFPLHLFDDMLYSMPPLPKVRIGNIGFLRRNI